MVIFTVSKIKTTWKKWRWSQNEERGPQKNFENEDNLKIENNLMNKGNIKIEFNLNEDSLKKKKILSFVPTFIA